MGLQSGHDERGSLPVVMLAAIVIAGLVVVLVSTANAGQRQARFDQGFEQALQVAEVGLDRLVYLAESGQLGGGGGVTFADVDAGAGVYSASATEDSGTWTLTSTGEAPDGTERTVTFTARPVPFFSVGFFADESLQSDGTTDFGVVDEHKVKKVIDGLAGTNKNVSLNGFPSMGLGKLVLANWGQDRDEDRCSYQGNPNPPCGNEDYFDHMDERYQILDEERQKVLDDVADGCTPLASSTLTTLPAGDYCVTTPLTLGNPFTVTGSGAVRLLVSGTGEIQIGNTGSNRNINWTGEASQLQVYSTDAILVDIRSGTNVKALVYAPSAACYGRGNVVYHGALMCRVIDTGGNSQYWMPDDLIDVGLDRLTTYDWRESAP